ncbi:protein DMR6-LIKE OXYGENASE 2-like isoform X1 [Cynara cardunculus var. scolymus]|uniref:protein DMR6-LIKE OXYGENASE 2-like isoform X1 n=1 Tax=Cynara cardunculus var. scolymus TaxID=59895 RepID=UPI000D629DC8|nr:protein DMR6-LIKE OXYGENASE 2-like isoform X1 [Cynara cardunculus var. scolymus]
MNSVKALAESPDLNSIPSLYAYSKNATDSPASDPQDPIPTIDFSLLTSADPDQRSQVIQELDKACKDWGFFQVINHGVPESLMKMVMEKAGEFFNLTGEEKQDFQEKDVLDPIRYGTSFNSKKDKVFCWRDFLKVIVHPEFHSPNTPLGFRFDIKSQRLKGLTCDCSEVLLEYSNRTREVVRGLLSGISTSLGLDQSYVEKALKLESGLQICIANLYPPCPQPEVAIGLPPHSDHGLLTLVINNGVSGLQIKHDGKWIDVKDTLPNSFLVNTADQLEIFSNGKYKSVEHRAVVNDVVTRISVVVANGPALDAVVRPADKLVDEERRPVAYIPMKYEEYLKMQQGNQINGKTCLDRVRV